MNILALDTCTECCSTALLFDGQLYEQTELTQRGHSNMILGMMDALFKQAGTTIDCIDALAFGRGPGSFTGVRVGVGVAQGIAFARNIPVIPVSTLAAVAQDAADRLEVTHIAVAMDARMGEIYCASFVNENGVVHCIDEERVCPPEAFTASGMQIWTGIGTGWGVYEQILRSGFADKLDQVSVEHYPQATAIIKLAEQLASQGHLLQADQAMPVYLRNNVAKKKEAQ